MKLINIGYHVVKEVGLVLDCLLEDIDFVSEYVDNILIDLKVLIFTLHQRLHSKTHL